MLHRQFWGLLALRELFTEIPKREEKNGGEN
jgi:hypothetical protein